MKTNLWIWIVCGVAWFGSSAAAQSPQAAELSTGARTTPVVLTPDYMDELSEMLRTNHPGLRAASERVRAAGHGIRGVRTWDDPMLMAGGEGGREEMRAEEGDILYGVEQRLPLFGKARRERQLAVAEQAKEESAERLQFQTLRLDLVKRLFQAALATRLAHIEHQDHGWIVQMTEVIRRRLGTGDAMQRELLMMENESAMHLNRVRMQEAELAGAQAALNRLINKPLESGWEPLELPPVADEVLFDVALVELSLRHEPQLRLLRQEIEIAKAMLAKTERARFSDIAVGLEGRTYSGDGSFRSGAVLLRFNLPFVNKTKYDADIARDLARLRAAEAEVADYELEAQSELKMLTIEASRARQEAIVYRDEIAPRAALVLRTSEEAWSVDNRAPFRDVFEARRQLLEARRMEARVVAEQHRLLAEVVLCCGLADFKALEMLRKKQAAPDGNPK